MVLENLLRAKLGRATWAPLAALVALFATSSTPANAMKIQTIKSPGGIEAWLVEEHAVPMMAMRFAFDGGSSQDPVGKEGLANFVTAMLDEGAGDLSSREFQERMEDISMRMSYEEAKDAFYGNFETLTANRDEAAKLLQARAQQAALRGRRRSSASASSSSPASSTPPATPTRSRRTSGMRWPSRGIPTRVRPTAPKRPSAPITHDDLEGYRKRIFAKDTLKVVAVGDIDATQLGKLLDEVFGDLPAKAELAPVSKTAPVIGGKQEVIEMNVPQSVAVFGLGAMPRRDPEFIPAFVLNQILGGGGFASKLMEEVREKRGLAYSVYTYVYPYQHASIFSGGVATRNDAMGQSLDVIRDELKKMADNGPSQEDLDNAKNYLIGSYPLRFDTNSKIATQLLGPQDGRLRPRVRREPQRHDRCRHPRRHEARGQEPARHPEPDRHHRRQADARGSGDGYGQEGLSLVIEARGIAAC